MLKNLRINYNSNTLNQVETFDYSFAHHRSSIIIVSYNSLTYLAACLESVLATIGSQDEVILVDNASQDDSALFVARKFPTVHLVINNQNVGFAAANNQAVKQATGSFIVALNPDTVVTPGWLEALVAPLKADQEVGLTTPRILMLQQPHLINACGNTMHYTGLTVCRGLGLNSTDLEWARSCNLSAVSGACFATPRSLWEKLGGLDDTFFMYLEDTDFSFRTRLAGYQCRYVADTVIYHDYSSRFSAQKFFYLERNRGLLLLKNYRWLTLLITLPALLLTELVVWGYALKGGPATLSAKFRSYAWLLSHLNEIKLKRQQVQQLRNVNDQTILVALEWKLNIGQLAGTVLNRFADYTINVLFGICYSVALWLGRL